MQLPKQIIRYFEEQSWRVADFQRHAWSAYAAGESGLIHAPTGSGKSLAAWLGPAIEDLKRDQGDTDSIESAKILWVTPLRALAADTVCSLEAAAKGLGVPWSVELRTGDTSASVKAKQKRKLPTCLVTTPESLSLVLSYREFQTQFRKLECVIVDEWHELVSTKRGVQLELCLARLRTLNPNFRIWGLSATLGDPQSALACLMGTEGSGRLIRARASEQSCIHSIMPESLERFPWSGHLGLSLLPQVVERIEAAQVTLVFTNTRSQAELWYEKLKEAKPEWESSIALHHSSIARQAREAAEAGLKSGTLRCVVCTSSLDLGVDFQPVDQVLQIGSPKGVARLLQRAGRSGHRPGVESAIYCVPTNALELAEIAAARVAQEKGRIEPRVPLEGALDVLAQHCVTLALADGFDAEALFEEARATFAFRALTREQWQWTLDFVSRGGTALKAYPQYRRVEPVDGRYRSSSRQIALRHRMTIGTIGSDSAIRVRWLRGGFLGTVEESFIGKLKKGDAFLFGGRLLELAATRDMTAYVRVSKKRNRIVPRWQGGRIPLSTQLAETLQELLSGQSAAAASPEMERLTPLLALQAEWSELPRPGVLLVEHTCTREGNHLYVFPFAGRSAHEGIGNLFAWRLSRQREATFHITANDYGFEIYSREAIAATPEAVKAGLSPENWQNDLLEGINEAELSKRQFRDIARIAGLVFPGYPGKGKSTRQLQASSELIFEVLRKYDPENQLLAQSQREVLDNQIDRSRIAAALESICRGSISAVTTKRLTPLAFPLWAERIRAQTVSSETWETRVRKMAERLNRAAGEAKQSV